MQKLIKPPKLSPGDKVAAITLSRGIASRFPHRFKVGKERLESIFGLQVVPTKHALKSTDWIYRNPKARADDLMEAFSDPNIKAIVSISGGYDSIRLLPFIDFNIIKKNPKIFIGYSDITVIHFMCLKAGLQSFYGPMLMADFGENVKMPDYTIQGVRDTLFSNKTIGSMPQNKEGWMNDLLDWENPKHQKVQRKLHPATPWKFIGNCKQPCKGRLIGGCLEVLQFFNGTTLWPAPSDWNNCILFLETSEEGIEPDIVVRFMRNLAAQGILKKLKGILFSKPGGCHITAKRFPEYDKALLQVFEEYKLPMIPIVTRMDFGHTEPMWTLPYGALTEINPRAKTVTILENST